MSFNYSELDNRALRVNEIRPVQSRQERLKEAAKHGFKHAIVPFANAPKQVIPGMKVSAVKTLAGALAEV